MRKLADMTPEERAAYTIWKSRLDSDMSSPEEKQEARRQMDALEWSGTTGPVMKRIGDIEERLQSIEVLKGNRKFPVSKQAFEKAKADIESDWRRDPRTGRAARRASPQPAPACGHAAPAQP